MGLPEKRDSGKGQGAKQQGAEHIQCCGRNHHGRNEQQRKRILDAAGEKQQRRQLHNVIGEKTGRLAGAQAPGRRIGDRQDDIEHRTAHNRGRRQEQWKIKIQHHPHDEKGNRLADHGKPSQIVECAEAYMSSRAAK